MDVLVGDRAVLEPGVLAEGLAVIGGEAEDGVVPASEGAQGVDEGGDGGVGGVDVCVVAVVERADQVARDSGRFAVALGGLAAREVDVEEATQLDASEFLQRSDLDPALVEEGVEVGVGGEEFVRGVWEVGFVRIPEVDPEKERLVGGRLLVEPADGALDGERRWARAVLEGARAPCIVLVEVIEAGVDSGRARDRGAGDEGGEAVAGGGIEH